jgi:signal transduction histidine kinase
VIDTGPGIAPETLGKIFNPYFTTKSSGTGLGLPTTKRLIEEHGGRVEVRSEVGRGSDFRVVLPLTEVAAGR